MKKIFLTIALLVLIGTNVFAQYVSSDLAENIAREFFSNMGIDKSNSFVDISREYSNNTLVLYIINFSDGGWIIVSANKYTKPVLAFGEREQFQLDTMTLPPPLVSLIENYKQNVISNTSLENIDPEWEEILTVAKLKDYSTQKDTSLFLLYDKNRGGEVAWSQGVNYDYGCSPSYNKYTPSTNSSKCDCDHKPIGCAAVAMGQIMWKWQWPLSYNWDKMPIRLCEGNGDEIPQLLFDCAEKANTHYMNVGSWATIQNVTDAFYDFNYKSATYLREKWCSKNILNEIVKTEIACGRPVLFRGGEVIDPDDWGNVHYFVIEGYKQDNPNYFYINWGWGFSSDIYSYYTLPELKIYGNDYSDRQMAIIGIAPTISDKSKYIYDVPYEIVSDYQYELALNKINIPSSQKSLIIKKGASYRLRAKNAISLNEGFVAEKGCEFSATLDYTIPEECEITLDKKATIICRNTQSNHNLTIFPENANSYLIQISSINGSPIYKGAGVLYDDYKNVVFNGDNIKSDGIYVVDLQLFNNCGETKNITYKISASSGCEENSLKSNRIDAIEDEQGILLPEIPMIYPNPAKDKLIVLSNGFSRIDITNIDGKIVYSQHTNDNVVEIDISNYALGTYIVSICIDNQKIVRKFLKE